MTRLITISGPPGSGKTTLSRLLAERLNAQLVEFDRFEVMTRRPQSEVMAWQSRGSPYEELMTAQMRAELAASLVASDVIFDTPLGPSVALPKPPSLSVWIDLPSDIALARKVGQLASGVPNAEAPRFLEWVQGYLRAYETITHPQIVLQAHRVRPLCNLVLSPRSDVQALVQQIVSQLSKT